MGTRIITGTMPVVTDNAIVAQNAVNAVQDILVAIDEAQPFLEEAMKASPKGGTKQEAMVFGLAEDTFQTITNWKESAQKRLREIEDVPDVPFDDQDESNRNPIPLRMIGKWALILVPVSIVLFNSLN